MKLTRATQWRPVATMPIDFPTHHPQGMVKIGDDFFVSSVEIRMPTSAFRSRWTATTATPARASATCSRSTPRATSLADLTLGEGSIYHPGGIDYDGRHIWVPVAEYRPNSRSIVYRVDPETMKATEVFRFGDHIGGIVHNTDDHTLHGVSWGSRRFYDWTLDARRQGHQRRCRRRRSCES